MDEQQLIAVGGRRITADTDPEELVLTPEAEQRLGWIADWLNQSPRLAGESGLKRYIDGGFRALFRGPSGTGKTMAAVALARATGRDLYRVDLAAVISRYIAETERNLRQFFEHARQDGAILLFDEADALLGRRSEIKDSQDRYANLEINYLMRRIEAFEGLAVLTTDRTWDLDYDAISRIDVLVDFPMPDEAAREQLWIKILAAVKVPQGDDLDVRTLAAKHVLSGAEILRAVRVAASIASSAERELDMQLLQSAAAERLAMREQ
jgi:SpoVK/Ycf46/Vps4 family AAA+-type ATPase